MNKAQSMIATAVDLLKARDPTFTVFDLHKDQSDSDFEEFVDCLLENPDVLMYLSISCNKLTDETGAKLARYVASSTTIAVLDLAYNRFSVKTYAAMAAALHVNTSLHSLYLYNNEAVDKNSVSKLFVDALRINPNRNQRSHWWFYEDDAPCLFNRLQTIAAELGHPTLQDLLAGRHLVKELGTLRRAH